MNGFEPLATETSPAGQLGLDWLRNSTEASRRLLGLGVALRLEVSILNQWS